MIRLSVLPQPEARSPMTHNILRGEFTATLGGHPVQFDTRLGTVARLEDHCGGRPVLEVVNAAVTGRRAADRMALIAGALTGIGHTEAEALAARATVPEAEAFILALMGALGFTLTPTPSEERDPLDGSPAGDAGGSSPSAA